MANEPSDLHRIIVVGGGAGGLELVTQLSGTSSAGASSPMSP
jgi:NADH dehydrogenase FAD-containing subunit